MKEMPKCYDLTRLAHDSIKHLGGLRFGDTIMRNAQLENENISGKDKKIIYNEIDEISDKLYKIEKILSKYEA